MRKHNFGKFMIGPGHIFNDVPENEDEALQHGNALAASGNYPVGTSECFNVGISGGCGCDCFVFKKGMCSVPEEITGCDDDAPNPAQTAKEGV